jgi:hypothetical protein
MSTFRTSMISLVAGIVFGFLIHNPVHTTPIPDVTTLDVLCGEIADQEWVQRKIFHDYGALRWSECERAQLSTKVNDKEGGNESLAERLGHFLASLFGHSKVPSSDQPKSIASTP